MLKNLFLTAFRNLWKQKLYTLINLLGLATGSPASSSSGCTCSTSAASTASCRTRERVYRVVGQIEMEGQGEHSSSMVFGLGPTLFADHPELIERYCRWFDFQDPQHTLKVGDSLQHRPHVHRERTLLGGQHRVRAVQLPAEGRVIRRPRSPSPAASCSAQELAKKYFGDADPMGQMMKWDNAMDVQVTGILGEIPRNSHIHFEGLVSMGTILQFWKNIERNNWVWNPCWTYVRLKEGITKAEVERVFPDFIQKYYPDFLKDQIGHELQPLTDIHLTSKLDFEMHQNGDAGQREHPVGHRLLHHRAGQRELHEPRHGAQRVPGARSGRAQGGGRGARAVDRQFLLESVLMSVIAALIALG
jgi:putative ABC transport system permease protein